jgi:hypothetical protein
MDELQKAQAFVALCLLGTLLFNYPFLALFNRPALVFGIPVFYAYLFIVWAVLIVAMAWLVGRQSDGEREGE